MRWFIEVLGELYDALKGPSITQVFEGKVKNEIVRMHATAVQDDVVVYVQSRQIIYRTTYSRLWVPSHCRTVYEVVCVAPEYLREKLDARFFIPTVYPMLCNPLLKWTEYPHAMAINAFIDGIRGIHTPFQMSL